MPWLKVDDKLHDHRKTRKAQKAAMGVWVLAGSWCMDTLSDGFVPESILPRWGNRRDALRLVEVGFWEPGEKDGECGWFFINWHDFQPSKAEVEAERAATKERVRKWREARRNKDSNAVTNGVTNGAVTPDVRLPRPDPTRPDPSTEPKGSGATAADSASTLIGEWIDRCPERPPGRVINHVGRELKAMLDEGIPYPRVRAGLAAWHGKRLHPSALASVVHETTLGPATSIAKPSTTDQRVQAALDLAAKYRDQEAQQLAIEEKP